MNFLAHAFLSGDCPETLVGNLMADFVRGRTPEVRSVVRAGISLHRAIDAFTDRHPVVVESCRGFEAPHRRYAPVLLDLFFDHFLALDWHRYSREELDLYARRVYRLLEGQFEEMPAPMRAAMERMVAEDWLCGYRRLAGIQSALERLERRARFPNRLSGASEELVRRYVPLRRSFHQFFPDLIRHAEGVRRRAPHPAHEV